MTLPARLRTLRLAAGLSVPALAAAAGVTAQAIRYLEAGSRAPSLETAARLAKALGTSIDELAGVAPAAKKPAGPRTH